MVFENVRVDHVPSCNLGNQARKKYAKKIKLPKLFYQDSTSADLVSSQFQIHPFPPKSPAYKQKKPKPNENSKKLSPG